MEEMKKKKTTNKKRKIESKNKENEIKSDNLKDQEDQQGEDMMEVDTIKDEFKSEKTAESKQEAEANEEEEEEKEEAQEDVIDPRIHYRPVVSELQAAVSELHQLINSIDLIRRREFLEEMYCMRENTAPSKEDLEYLIESKSTQIKEASQILMNGTFKKKKTKKKQETETKMTDKLHILCLLQALTRCRMLWIKKLFFLKESRR